MVTFGSETIKRIIAKLLQGQDYRIEVLALINAEFLAYAIDFLKRVAQAKFDNLNVTPDWYRQELLDPNLPPDDLAIHAGLNRKTITNMYNSGKRVIVIDAALQHYEQLYATLQELIEHGQEIDLTLSIKFRGVSIDLNINESLIVINTLAVKRAQLRGGAWSSTGKQVEKLLMQTMCRLYQVPEACYALTGKTQQQREVDFYLLDAAGKRYACEVKLMGKGNPESADATIARDSALFIADKLSDLNKTQLVQRGTAWIELRSEQGYRKFGDMLTAWGIPHQPFTGDLTRALEPILNDLLQNEQRP
ncbi:MAG: CfrBI family restriction endonuclease [Anaerolineales bacterium]